MTGAKYIMSKFKPFLINFKVIIYINVL